MLPRCVRISAWRYLAVCGIIALGIGLGINTAALAENGSADRATRSTHSYRSSKSAGTKDESVESLLRTVIKNQQAILSRFDDVMEELRVIKVRSSLSR